MAEQIPIEDLVKGKWYVGRGRRGNVALWNGERFLTIGDWFGEPIVKVEPYYGPDEGCFQPFALVDEGVIVEPFGRMGWDRHYGRRLEFGQGEDPGNIRRPIHEFHEPPPPPTR